MRVLGLPRRTAERVACWLVSPRGVKFWGEPFFRLKGRRGKARELSLVDVHRLLIVRLDQIGDVVMTTSLLREFRRNLPNAWITLVVKPSVKNLVDTCPYVNEILTYDWSVSGFDCCEWSGPGPHLERHRRALQLARSHLWDKRFDLAVVPRWDTDLYNAAFVAYFSGAPARIGHSDRNATTPGFYDGVDQLFTQVITGVEPAHEVERTLSAIKFLKGKIESLAPEIWTSEHDDSFANKTLSLGDATGPFVAFGLGAGEPKRIWPTDNFIEVARWLKQNYDAHIVLVGGPSELALAQQFQQSVPFSVTNLVGHTTLRQTAAVLRLCNLFLGNDSGAMHLAAAVGTTVAEISCHPLTGSMNHQNSPKRFGPWGNDHILLQPDIPLAPCIDGCMANEPHCIMAIKSERVKNAIHERFKSKTEFIAAGASDYAD